MIEKDYLTNGKIQQAIAVVDAYVKKIQIKGIERKVIGGKKEPPMVFYTIPAQGGSKGNILLYGHLDKQPWMDGWHEGLGPTKPVIKDGHLYGRGGADDGYSVLSAMLAIKNAQMQGVPTPRCVMVLESEEESGSPHLVQLLK